MSAFVCTKCRKVVLLGSEKYVIEIAAKRNDADDRARQVSTLRFCKEHAIEYIEVIRSAWTNGRVPSTGQFIGQEALL